MGSALKKNNWSPMIPSHRVVARNGGIGAGLDWGHHAEDSIEERMDLLRSEGLRFDKNGKILGTSFREFNTEACLIHRKGSPGQYDYVLKSTAGSEFHLELRN